MKRFLINLGCLFLALVLILCGLGSVYALKFENTSDWQIPPEKMPEQIDLAVIGSSHALFAIDLSPYSSRYFNFSMTGQTPRYDLAILREYQDRIVDGATVLMTMSYISPFWTEPEETFLKKQARYYKLLSPENMIDYDFREALRVRMNTAIPATRILDAEASDLIRTFSSLQLFSRKAEPEVPATPQAPVRYWYDDLPRYASLVRREHMAAITPTFPEMNPDMLSAYQGIFQLAEQHNWKLIAVTTPFPRPYNELFDQEFYDVFYGHVEELCREGSMEYWDYSHDPAFTDDLILFGDMDHMVPKGCQLFSEVLARRLGLITP